jgi:hypothetical protein
MDPVECDYMLSLLICIYWCEDFSWPIVVAIPVIHCMWQMMLIVNPWSVSCYSFRALTMTNLY